jgi:hypothetical protein
VWDRRGEGGPVAASDVERFYAEEFRAKFRTKFRAKFFSARHASRFHIGDADEFR